MEDKKQEPKKELAPDQIMHRHIRSMSDRQMSARVNRIARESEHNMDAAWAIVLAQVFDNTKPNGTLEPFLR